MILPLRVLGSPGTMWITSGAAKAPIACRTCSLSAADQLLPVAVVPRVEQHVRIDALALDRMRVADDRASATASCATSALSISAVPIRCPDTFSTSSMRPVIQ